MRQRCGNPNATGFERYGGRGIQVCERWQTFENFLADMGERPEGASLDRIDNAKGYEPSNCRWSSATVQGSNKCTNVKMTIGGRTLTVTEWAREFDAPKGCVFKRLAKGWELLRALTEPPDPRKIRTI